MSVIDIEVSDIFTWNNESKAQVNVNQGGTSSGKTYNIVILLFCRAIEEPESIITVVSEDVPALKSGALRDAEKIYKSSLAFQQEVINYNKTDRYFVFRNGSVIEFKSYSDVQDAHNGKRDYLFINEAQGVSYEIYKQLELRTAKQIFIDYNPSSEFWVHEHVIGKKNTELFISDHRHNPWCPQSVRDKVESYKDEDLEFWKIYARGLTGKIEGLILRNYNIVPDIPKEAEIIAGGMDFGFTNDPTTYLNVYRMDGELWIDELIYDHGLTNKEIISRLIDFNVSRSLEIIADSAEPKSIAEISSSGFTVIPALKGPDSIRQGLDILKRFKLNITTRSHGLKKEIAAYKWKMDKSGKPLNVPIDFMNHSIDALRYVALNKLSKVGGSGSYSWSIMGGEGIIERVETERKGEEGQSPEGSPYFWV